MSAPERMTEDQQRLVTDHVHLAKAVAEKLARRWPSLADDVYSAALVGLCDAAVKFRPEDGHQFGTYAPRRITGAVLDYMRQEGGLGMGSTRGMMARGDAPTVFLASSPSSQFVYDGRIETLADTIPSGDMPVGWEMESEDYIRGVTRRMGRAGAVIRMYLLRADLEGRLRDVGEALGFSESRASQLASEALTRLGAPVTATLDGRGRHGEGRSRWALKRQEEAAADI